MTKKLFDSFTEAVNSPSIHLFDWLYEHEAELSREEIALIARELAYATFYSNEAVMNETVSKHLIKQTFLSELSEWYDAFGFDDEEAE